VQDTFERALRIISQKAILLDNLPGYLYTLCRNICLRICRDQKAHLKKQIIYENSLACYYSPSYEDQILENDIAEYIKNKHGEEALSIFILRYDFKLTSKKIAHLKSTTVPTIDNKTTKIRRKAKRFFL